MNQELKERLRLFLPQNGLNANESFIIRSRAEHARGGTNETYHLLIDEAYNFSCSIDVISSGHFNNGNINSFSFYICGKTPLQIVAGLELIKKEDKLRQITSEYSNFDSYQGNFDITYKTENLDTTYLDFNLIEFFPKENPKSDKKVIEKHLTEQLLDVETKILVWLGNLNNTYGEMLSKGVLSMEIEYN